MLAVNELDEPCLRIVLFAEEHLGDRVLVANTAKIRTFLAAKTDTRMTAFLDGLQARLIARSTVTWLVTQFGALFVLAFPCAFLFARSARFEAFELALGVDATVRTLLLTRWTLLSTSELANMAANEGSLTLLRAVAMNFAAHAFSTSA